ncbi:MAG: hypothetical protein DMG86_08120 [Acidobacteria bacterium]|nr:MAG: hypothetical protein DMG86_08120 [Acidobacteriota bacterium]PYX63435.1 MAG: hypothetical protein DMG74_17095 [Acidobacteriota bacterium]
MEEINGDLLEADFWPDAARSHSNRMLTFPVSAKHARNSEPHQELGEECYLDAVVALHLDSA